MARDSPAGAADAGALPFPVDPGLRCLDRLATVTAPLSHMLVAEEVHALLTRQAREAFVADAAILVGVIAGGDLGLLRAEHRDGGEAAISIGPGVAALVREGWSAPSATVHGEGASGPPRTALAALHELGARSVAVVPLIARGHSLALLLLARAGAMDPAISGLLDTFVLPFALALDRFRPAGGTAAEERHLAAIVRGSDDAIFSKTLDGIILSWNSGAERMYGYRPEEIIGRPVTTLVADREHNDVPAIMARLRRGERVDHYETVRKTKDGRILEVALTISPMRDDSGRLVGASTIARDITQRRRAEARRRLMADLGRTLSDTLDENRLLRDLAHFLVRGMADYCVTYALATDGSIRRVGVAHAEPGQQKTVERLLEVVPPRIFDTHGAGAVIATGEPILAESIPAAMLERAAGESGEYLEVLQALRPVSSMILPLRARGRTLGAFSCATVGETGRHYTRDDLLFAMEIANRAALALDNGRLFAESRAELRRREEVEAALRVRYEQLRVLYQMTDAVGRAAGLDEIYDEVFRAVRRYLGTERASILLWDADGVMRFKAWRGLSEAYRAAVEGHSPWERDAKDPRPVVVPDVSEAPDIDASLRETFARESIGAVAFIPLVFRRQLLGKFMLYFAGPRDLTADELDMCQAIAGTIAFAITRMLDEQNVRTARDLAERASQAKSQFLGVMSHELRTPLNAVIGYSDLLLMEIRGDLSAGQREQVDRIRSSASHQLGLIEELLTYTRLEAGHEHARFMVTDVPRIVGDVAEFVRPEAERKGIDLRIELPDEPIELVTDPAKLRQIVLNFAGNATKFTRAGQVVLRVRHDRDTVAIEVEDTGPGIPAGKLDYIFQPFAQVEEGRTRPSGGTGLGLAIARRFTEMLGGEVSVESRPGEGSTFCITLPVRPPRNVYAAEAPPSER